jgi:hypothetical protein
MRAVDLNPQPSSGAEVRVPADTRLLEDAHGVLASVLGRHGVATDDVAERLATKLRDLGVRDEKLLKRFELPLAVLIVLLHVLCGVGGACAGLAVVERLAGVAR